VTDLAITARCLEQDLLGRLEPEVAEHVVEVFVERRGQDPESGETMARVGGPLRKLHADLSGGRSVRAVTWYDRSRDVCWLLAAGIHEGFYEYVEELAKTGAHLPTATDVANFEADAPVRLMSRIVRNARSSLEEALQEPGKEVPLTEDPPPKAYFRVDDDRLCVRVVMYGRQGFTLTAKQLAAIQTAVFGTTIAEREYPEDAQCDSIYLVGPIPSLDSWPPPERLL
jgi:hypothetical protein